MMRPPVMVKRKSFRRRRRSSRFSDASSVGSMSDSNDSSRRSFAADSSTDSDDMATHLSLRADSLWHGHPVRACAASFTAATSLSNELNVFDQLRFLLSRHLPAAGAPRDFFL